MENIIRTREAALNKGDIAELLCDDSKVARNQIIFICLSYALAAFDFIIYLKLAPTIGTVFFPATDNALLIQLKLIGLVSVGFLSRPLGALLIGRYGDKRGRKPALMLSVSFLSITTFLVAFLPTYAQIGVVAPILFLVIRILQGIAFGAHAPLSWVFIAEHAPKNRLVTYCSLAVAGGIFGSMLAVTCAKVLTGTLDSGAMLSYGWRIPALIGGLFGGLSFLIWPHVKETPIFTNANHNQSANPSTLETQPFVTRSSALMLSIVLSFVRASLIMVIMLLLPKLIALKFYNDPSFLINASLVALVMQILGCVIYGILADKMGTGKVFMLGSMALIVQIWVLYAYLSNGHELYILPMYGLLGFCTGMIGLCTAIFVQVFPTEVRLTAVSVVYNVISALLGAVLPFLLFYATRRIGVAPALYLTFIGMISFIVGFHLYHRETFGELYAGSSNTKKYSLKR